MEHPVGSPHKRLGQALFVMNELEREAPFDTQVPVIEGLSRRGTADTNDFPIFHVKVHLTTDATEVACGPNLFFGEREHPQRLHLGHRPGRTGVDAATTEFTGGI